MFQTETKEQKAERLLGVKRQKWIKKNAGKDTRIKEDFDEWLKVCPEDDYDKWHLDVIMDNEVMRRKSTEENELNWIVNLALLFDSRGLLGTNTLSISSDSFDHTEDLLNSKLTNYKSISKTSFQVKALGYTIIFIKGLPITK